MKKIVLCFLSLYMLLSAPVFSFAHPGHGDSDGFSIIHYFKEPIHAVLTVGILVLAFLVVRFAMKKKQQ